MDNVINMYFREAIALLLLINTGFYLNKQLYVRRYRVNTPEAAKLKATGIGYLLLNIICVCIVFLV